MDATPPQGVSRPVWRIIDTDTTLERRYLGMTDADDVMTVEDVLTHPWVEAGAASLFGLGFGLDLATTALLVPYPGIVEGNPVVAFAMATLGIIPGIVAVKGAVFVLGIGVMALFTDELRPAVTATAGISSFPWLLGGVLNLTYVVDGRYLSYAMELLSIRLAAELIL